MSAVCIKMLQWFYFYNTITILSLFPHIVQSYTYEQLSLLFRGRNASLHLFALLSSTEKHYVSTEHEPWSWGSVLRCVPAEGKPFYRRAGTHTSKWSDSSISTSVLNNKSITCTTFMYTWPRDTKPHQTPETKRIQVKNCRFSAPV